MRIVLTIVGLNLVFPVAMTSAQAPATALSSEGTTFRGTIQKAGSQPARFHTTDDKDLTVAEFAQVLFAERTKAADVESAGAISPTLPFLVAWNRVETMAAAAPTISDAKVQFPSPLGTLKLPLSAVREIVARFPGDPIWSEPFDTMNGWEPKADAPLSEDRFRSAPRSLLLTATSPVLTRPLRTPLDDGILTLSFFDPGLVHKGSRWGVTLDFGAGDALEPARSVVFVGGWNDGFYSVQFPPELKMAGVGAPRSTGWHELKIRFSPSELFIELDGRSLVASHQRGMSAPLKRLVLGTLADASEPDRMSDPTPRVWIDDLRLAKPLPAVAASFSSPQESCVQDRHGDQWMGDVLGADSNGVRLRSPGGHEQVFPWKAIQKLRFAEPAGSLPPQVWEGEIGIVSAGDSRFVAELLAADERQWSLHHPLLGDLKLPLPTIESWQPLIVGRRTVVFPGSFHLGNKFVSEFRRPMADGSLLKVTFDYPEPKGEVAVTLFVDGMEGTGPMAAFARKIRAGAMTSELWINETRVEALNRLLIDRPLHPLQLRVPVPAGVLHEGKNVLEIRQLADPETGFHDEAEIFQVAIDEIAASREANKAKGQP